MQHDAPIRPAPQADITHTDEIHAGLMSGTSMDGVDGVLIAFDEQGRIRQTLTSAFVPMPEPLRRQLTALQHPAPDELAAADVQATLLALTAESTAQAIRAQNLSAVYLCGGGAENAGLTQAIQQAVGPETHVQSTHALGIAPQAVEASGFAWLARQRVHEAPIPLTRITGSRHDSILGAWHKAPARQP